MSYRYRLFGNNICDIIGGSFYNRQFNIVKESNIKYHLFENIKYNDDECYVFICNYENLNHLLHDEFFIFYSVWRKNKKQIYIKLYNQYFLDYITAIIGKEYLIQIENNTLYFINSLLIVNEHRTRNLRDIPDYINILKEIKYNCFEYYNIIEDRKLNIIYGRENLTRRRLLNINYIKLQENDIKIIYDLSNYTFKETLEILSKAKNFIYVGGAGSFYLQFLDNNVNIIEIYPNMNDSWTERYGLCNVINLKIYVSTNTSSNDISANNTGQKNNKLDEDINYDLKLETFILNNIK